MANPLRVKGISGNEHSTVDYAILQIYIPGKDKQGEDTKAVMTREVHIVNSLDANMLIGTDVMVPERMDILLIEKKL